MRSVDLREGEFLRLDTGSAVGVLAVSSSEPTAPALSLPSQPGKESVDTTKDLFSTTASMQFNTTLLRHGLSAVDRQYIVTVEGHLAALDDSTSKARASIQ